MPAGTITLTNNSATVTGSGTSFTTELNANDFLVAVVGGITYTLGVKSVDSATSLTLITAYNGPTASGVAWTAVPNAALVGITAQVAADVAKAIRGLNLDKANWQRIFGSDASVTVTLPDGSTFTGPSWGLLSSVMVRRDGAELTGATPFIDFHFANTAADYDVRVINDVSKQLTITDTSGTAAVLRVLGGINVSGRAALGYVKATLDAPVGETGAYFAQNGSNSRMGIYNNSGSRSGGMDLVMLGANGVEKMRWSYNIDGAISGPLGAAVWQGSDRALKHSIEDSEGGEEEALKRLLQIRPREFEWNNNGKRDRGFIAQEMLAIDERYANYSFKVYSTDNDANDLSGKEEGVYGLSDRAIMADAIAVIQMQQKTIESQAQAMAELQARMKAIDGLDA